MATDGGERAEKWALSDLVALQALAPLARGYVPWTSWSMRPAAVATVVNEVEFRDRRSALELGAGCSTVFLGRALQARGGRLVSVEHDPGFAAHVQRVVDREGLGDTVTIVRAPLVPVARAREDGARQDGSWEDGAPDGWLPAEVWYDEAVLRAACTAPVDLLLVDGPPGHAAPGRLAREPAARVLADLLAPGWSLFLDDADRPAERETARRWSARLGVDLTVVDRLALAAGRSEGGPPLAL